MSSPTQATQHRDDSSPMAQRVSVASSGLCDPVAMPANGASAANHARPNGLRGLSRIVFFLCWIVVLLCGVNVMINTGLRRIKTSQFGVSNKIVQGGINADIVISGSSRAISHYDPRLIESITGHSAYNLGRNGSQTDMELAVLKTYLKHNRRPELVIQNLDAFSFVTTREVYDPAQYMPYLDEPDIYAALQHVNATEWWKNKHLPLYGYVVDDMRFTWIAGVRGFLGWSPREDFFLGFNPRTGQWTDEFEKLQATNPEGVSFPIEPAGVQVMQDLIGVCKDNGIKLVFVYSPEYKEMQSLTKNRLEIFSRFQDLAKQNNVPLWDFSSWNYADNRKFFRNSQHLNAEGARLFSDEFARKLGQELPRLIGNPAVSARR
jgi:hypothetical protein